MKLLHTGDWHVGKVLKGMSRHDEHVVVLDEIVALADGERVDAVIVAGDIFESAAPSPEAQRLAWGTLLRLRETGADVFVIAGNHDHPEAFEAVRPVFAAAGVRMLGRPGRPHDGGVAEVVTRSGESLRLASLPFCSQRGILRAEQLMVQSAAELSGIYGDRVRRLIDALTAGFAGDAANVLVTHAFVFGGKLGGGEREAQTIHDYGMSSQAFPSSAGYVALGHLHRFQTIPGPCPIQYAGSPIAVDFGEERDEKGVALVTLAAGRPAAVEHRVLAGARQLATSKGSADEVVAAAVAQPDAWWRAIVTDKARAGLADDIRSAAPNILEVRLDAVTAWRANRAGVDSERQRSRTPEQLFADYLDEQGMNDSRLTHLFGELLDAETSAEVEA